MLIHLVVPTARGRLGHRTARALQDCLQRVDEAIDTRIILRPGDGGIDALRYMGACDPPVAPILVVADRTYSDLVVRKNSRWHSVRPLVQLAEDHLGLWINGARPPSQLRDLASLAGGRICGDGSGGLDELFARSLALSAGLPLSYAPLQGRGAAAIQTIEDRAAAHVSSYSQEREAWLSAAVQPLDFRFHERFPILRRIPISTFVKMSMSKMRMDELAGLLQSALATASWDAFIRQETLKRSWLSRAAFGSSVAEQRASWLRAWSEVERSDPILK